MTERQTHTIYQLIEGFNDNEPGIDRWRTIGELGKVTLPATIGSEALDPQGTARRITAEEREAITLRLEELQKEGDA